MIGRVIFIILIFCAGGLLGCLDLFRDETEKRKKL